MDVRPFAWHDLAAYIRNRGQVLCLENALSLTRGNPVGLSAVLVNLDPSYGSFTGVSRAEDGSKSWIGQMRYRLGQHSAHLTYLIPDAVEDTRELAPLLDELAFRGGEWGAFNVLAELPEHSSTFESFRQSGFIVYARQSVWQLANLPAGEGNSSDLWRSAQPTDFNGIRTLYNCLVPPLVQSAEPFSQNPNGLVYIQDGEILAYVEGIFGPRGIYLLPVFHPGIDQVPELLLSLAGRLAPILNRPVYMAVRYYQAWLEMPLSELHARAVSRQALLVKHLTNMQRAPALNHRLVMMEKKHPEVSTPFLQHVSVSPEETTRVIDRVV